MIDKVSKKYLLIFIFLLFMLMIIPISFAENISDSNQTNGNNAAVGVNSPIANESSGLVGAGEKNIYVSTTGDDNHGEGTQSLPYKTLDKALSEATASKNNIYMANGTYKEYGFAISKNINIIGSGNTIIDADGGGRFFRLAANVDFTLSDLTLQNVNESQYGGAIYIRESGISLIDANLVVNRVKFINIYSGYSGGAIYNVGGATVGSRHNNVSITNCEFINCGSKNNGVILTQSSTLIANCTFIGSKCYSTTSTFVGSSIAITATATASNVINITGCTFIGDSYGKGPGGVIYSSATDLGSVIINNNAFILDEGYGIYASSDNSAVKINADNNWWGTNTPDFNKTTNNKKVKLNSYVTLNLTADSEIIDIYEDDEIAVSFYNNGTNAKNMLIPSRNISLTTTGGKINPNPNKIQGEVKTNFSSESFGQYTITAKVDNQELSADVMVCDLTDKTVVIAKTKVEYKDVTIDVQVGPKSATGNVTFTLNGKKETIELTNAKGSITLYDVPFGEYDNILLTYNGDANHNKSNTTISFVVSNKYPVTLSAEGIVDKSSVTICADLNRADATGNVTFTLNGNRIIYINEGKGNITISNLANDDYEVELTYNGDENYQKAKTTLKFTVSNRNSTKLTINPVVEGDNVTVYAKINETLATGNVTFTLKYKTQVIELKNGEGSIKVTSVPNDVYNLTFTYTGDRDYEPAEATETFIVSVRKDTILTAEATVQNQVVIIDADINYYTASGNVTFTINGEDKVIDIVKSKGSITLENVPFASYSILLTYNGDINYNPSNYTLNFEVIKYDYGKILYVSNSGNDSSNGSASAPLKTLSKAIDVANHFPIVEKIYIYDGIYTDSGMTIERSLDIEGQSQENTIIDAQGGSLFEIYGLENNVTFTKITFKNGYNENGGAIRDYGHVLNVTNCTFINNMGSDMGGAIYHYYGEVNIQNSIFRENVAITGGAVYVSTYTDLTKVNNCEFSKNYALSGIYAGGAIYNAGYLYVNASTFTENRAASRSSTSYDISGGDGGAIYNANQLIVYNSQFTSNSAYFWGGAIRAGGYSYIYYSNFTNNSAGSRGGAIHSSGSGSYSAWTTYITGCNFEDNLIGRSAYEGSTMIGGAVCAESPTAIRDSSFSNNTSPYGGAIFMRSNAKYIYNCSFIENSALCGGAIYSNFTMGVISYSEFIKNNAVLGGAVLISASRTISEDSFLNLTSNTYISNSAEKGGAIYSDAGYASPQEVNIMYSEFINDTALQGREIFTTNRANIEYNAIICDVKDSDVINVVPQCEGIVSLENNWWGINNPNLRKIIVGIEIPFVHAVLNLTATPQKISNTQTSTIAAKLMWNDTAEGNVKLIPARNITLKVSKGKLTNTEGVLDTEFTSKFSSDADGSYKITAQVDNEILPVVVVVNKESPIPKENVTLDVCNVVISEGENAIVEVYLPEYATGKVSVDGIISTVSYATATISIPNLAGGNYTFDVVYSGDNNYNGAVTTVNVTVNPKAKKNATLTANDVVVKEGEIAKVVVNIDEDATGTITVKDKTSTINRGRVAVVFDNLAMGNYTFDVVYSGDLNYNAAKTTVTIRVISNESKLDPSIKIDAPDITQGENATVTVTLPSDATGTVTVKDITVPIKNGVAVVSIPNLALGRNTLKVIYSGDEKYNEVQTTVTVKVKRDLTNAIYANASTGSDEYGDGSKGNPVKTIYKALTLAGKNGTVVLTGTFKGNQNTELYLSSYINNVTFIGMDGAVIDGEHMHIIFSITDGEFTFIDLTLKNAYSAGYGAAIINQAGYLTVEDCTFIDNIAQGSAAIDNTGWAMVTGCNFTNNLATLYDGAALSSNWEIYIYNSSFTSNHAYHNGGAIKNYEEGYMFIEGCEFIANEASGSSYGSYGGAVYSWASHVEIHSSNFSDNYASSKGGAVYASYGNAFGDFYCYIVESLFENNEAVTGSTLFIEKVIGNVSYNAFLDQNNVIYTDGTSCGINNNWWGVNDPDWATLLTGTIKKPAKYAVLEVTVNPENVTANSSAKLSYSFSWNGNGDTTNMSLIPIRPIELASTGGKLKDTSGYLDNGKFSTEFSSAEAGNYEITASVDNEEVKIKVVVTDEPINPKENITIDAPGVTKYYHGPERFVVTVKYNNGTPIQNQPVTIVINGVSYDRTTNENGTTSVALNLNSGNYTATVTANNTTVTSNVVIFSTVVGNDLVKVFKNASQYYATFLDAQGNPLPKDSEVTFNINGVMYKRKTNENGIAKLNINLQQGTYVITAINPINGEMHANNITVLSNIINNRDLVKYYRNASQYVVTLVGDDGKVVGAGENVTFNINGVFYTRTTNETGQAKLNINLQPGDYVITAEYKECKVSNNITVKPVLSASDLTKKYGTEDQFVATLLDGQGKAYAEQKVQFNINGVLYYRSTDSNGQAKLNIRLQPGEYIITSSFNGANIANKVTVTA